MALAVGSVTGFAWYRHRESRLRTRARRHFNQREFETALAAGATGSCTVRLWGRTCADGKHFLELHEENDGHATVVGEWSLLVTPREDSDATFVIDYPAQVEGAPSLRPNTSYVCRLYTAERTLVGTARFETAPLEPSTAPGQFAVAALSCHLPFDERGEISARAHRLLSIARAEMQRMNVKRVIMMGDQVYGDLPEHCSLFDQEYFESVAPPGRTSLFECDQSEVRQLYQRRYQIFWSGETIRDIHANFPCYLVADDHEILDNFGSVPEHSGKKYEAIAAGAFDAYFDYQASRTLGSIEPRPQRFEWGFEYGTLATFALDLRSERRATEDEIEICSENQLEVLTRFLVEHRASHVLCIVVSVPFLHVPDWFMQLGVAFTSSDGDVADRWSHPKARRSRDRLLGVLKAHQAACPTQRLVILGGDVHIGMVGRLDWGEGIAPSYQLVSSAFSNALATPVRQLVELFNRRQPVTLGNDGFSLEATFLENKVADVEQAQTGNPYGGLNMGIVQVERLTETESTVRLLLVGCTEDGVPEGKVVFDSGRL